MSFRRILLSAVLASGFAATAQAQCDTTFSLTNNSGMTIREFYFGSSANPNWGADRLGQNVLANGQTMRFDTRIPGANDFKVVWANNATAELMRIDICRTNQILATSTGIVAR